MSSILITGGTGTFGCAFIREFPEFRTTVLSRDEAKQAVLARTYPDVSFFLGDVRDLSRLTLAMHKGFDAVIHAAALKHVDSVEYNPLEAVHTNVLGSANVIRASLDSSIPHAICLSTDKACAPLNTYGATKLVMERMFLQANSYSSSYSTVFSAVRYGNVAASRGSVLEVFDSQARSGCLRITDPEMTRFWMTSQDAVRLVHTVLTTPQCQRSTVIPKLRAYNLADLACVFRTHYHLPSTHVETIGARPGEKTHEIMISSDELPYAREYDSYHLLVPMHRYWDDPYERPPTTLRNPLSSQTAERIDRDELYALTAKELRW